MCYGTGCAGYGFSLVSVRSGRVDGADQIGGLGVITVGASFSLLSGRRISLSQRGRMQEAMSAPKVGGIVRLTGFVIRSSLDDGRDRRTLYAPGFLPGFRRSGIWKAVFHSVSAFCNAGFDLMGTPDMPFVLADRISRRPGYQPDDFRPDRCGRYRLSDMG